MSDILNFKSIYEILSYVNLNCSVDAQLIVQRIEDVERWDKIIGRMQVCNHYMVIFTDLGRGRMVYGHDEATFHDKSLLFFAPGQVCRFDRQYDPVTGWMLIFHPDILHGSDLGKKIKSYPFFSYKTSMPLALPDYEASVLSHAVTCIEKEQMKMNTPASRAVVFALIEVILSYTNRLYLKKPGGIANNRRDLVTDFEEILDQRIRPDMIMDDRVLTVEKAASILGYSSSYLRKVLKKETGQTPQQHIQNKVLDLSKELLITGELSVSQIADMLGFGYTSSFTYFFKARTGMTPSDYKNTRA